MIGSAPSDSVLVVATDEAEVEVEEGVVAATATAEVEFTSAIGSGRIQIISTKVNIAGITK